MELPPVKHVSCFFCPPKLRRSFEGKEFCFFCSCIILMPVCQFVPTTDRAIAEVNCLSGQSAENNHNNNIQTGDKRPNVVNQSSWYSGLPCNAMWRVFDLSSPTQFEFPILMASLTMWIIRLIDLRISNDYTRHPWMSGCDLVYIRGCQSARLQFSRLGIPFLLLF